MIGENLPTVGAILLRKRGRELPQQPYRPVIMLALVYDRKAIALRTYHHDGSLKQSSEKACHQVSIYKLSYTLATGARKGSNDAGETSAVIHVSDAGWTYQCSIHDFHREILPSMVFDSKNLHTRKIAQKAGKSETAWKILDLLKTTKVSYDRKKGVGPLESMKKIWGKGTRRKYQH